MNKAKGQITIVDITDGKTLSMFLSRNFASQQYSTSDGSCYPDFTKNSLVVTPVLYIAGFTDDDGNVKNLMKEPLASSGSGLRSVKWYINNELVYSSAPEDALEYESNQAQYGVTCSEVTDVDSAENGWACVVSSNMNLHQTQFDFRCDIVYYDTSIQHQLKAHATTVVNKIELSSVAYTVFISTDGKDFIQNINDSVEIYGYGVYGNKKDTTGCAYEWTIWDNLSNLFVSLKDYYTDITLITTTTDTSKAGYAKATDSSGRPLYEYWYRNSNGNESNEDKKFGAHLIMYQDGVEDNEFIQLKVTDTNNAGEERVAYGTIHIDDLQDPYSIEIEGPTIVTQAESVFELTAHVYQNTDKIDNVTSYDWDAVWYADNGEAQYYTKKANDTVLVALDGLTETSSNKQTLKLTRAFINKKATFICTAIVG